MTSEAETSPATKKSRVVLGCMNFGPNPCEGGRVSELEPAREILNYFKERGHDEIDTARIYVGGKSESFLAEAGYKEMGFKLSTKAYPTTPKAHSPESLKATFATSLKALDTDSIDTFYLHAADRTVPFAETLEAIDELYRQGGFRVFGLSNFAAYEVAEIVAICRERGFVKPKVYMAMYNPYTRGIENELVPACRKYGLDILVYNPLAGGLFTEIPYGPSCLKYLPPSGRFSDTFHDQGLCYRNRYFQMSHFEALAHLAPISAKYKLTLMEMAMRWLVHHSALRTAVTGGGGGGPGNDGIVVGVSGLKHLKEDLDALEGGPLPDEVVEGLERGWKMVEGEGVCPSYWRGELKYSYTEE